MTYLIVLLVLFVVGLAFYLHAEKNSGFWAATAFKLVLSCFVCVVSFVGLLSHFSLQCLLVSIALVAAIFGDFFLQYIKKDNTKYQIGIVCFSVTQVLLLVSMFVSYGFSWIEFALLIAALVCALALMKGQKWKLGKEQGVLTVYTVLLSFMMAKALSVLFVGHISEKTILFAVGAVLFFVSDMLLGIWDYKCEKRAIANLNWITYFCGTMSIALSLWF